MAIFVHKKSPAYWRTFHSLPDDYTIDAAIFYGTWPHPNKTEPNHAEPLRRMLDAAGIDHSLQPLGETSPTGRGPVVYLDHAYELVTANHDGATIRVWVVPVEGTRLAGEYLEKARQFGAQKLIALGMCGGFKPGMRSGDFVMPTLALPNDTGRAYNSFPERPYVRPHNGLYNELRARLLQRDRRARIWPAVGYTDEAIHCQTPEKVRTWIEAGFDSVDMETAIVLAGATCHRFGPPVPAASLLYMIDNPLAGTLPSESDLLTPNQARDHQYAVAIDTVRGVPLGA